jgi:hypothetical protein
MWECGLGQEPEAALANGTKRWFQNPQNCRAQGLLHAANSSTIPYNAVTIFTTYFNNKNTTFSRLGSVVET